MKSNKEKIVFVIFTLIGICGFIIIGWLLYSDFKFRESALTTKAEITRIDNSYDDHDVYIEYEIDNIKYNGELNYYTSSMRTGDGVTIFYEPANPGNFRANWSNFILIFLIIPLIFFLIGLIGLVYNYKKSSLKKRLLTQGRRIKAKITLVRENKSYQVNGRNPYIIECSAPSISSSETYYFKSDNIWIDPRPYIEENNIKEITVIMDKYNPKKYYVMVEELKIK